MWASLKILKANFHIYEAKLEKVVVVVRVWERDIASAAKFVVIPKVGSSYLFPEKLTKSIQPELWPETNIKARKPALTYGLIYS